MPRNVVLTVGIDDGVDLGKPLVGLVMVDYDHIGAELARDGQRLVTGRSAIDGHDELGAFVDKRFDGGGIRAIAFKQTVGDVDAPRYIVMREKSFQKRGRTGAIDVVITEDRNRLLRFDGIGQA